MSATFLQLQKAQNEIIDAWDWYEEQREGLGDRFTNELALKINLIANNPLHYPKRRKHREAVMDNFPFIAVYQYKRADNLVIIVSVFHTSRNPRKKYKG